MRHLVYLATGLGFILGCLAAAVGILVGGLWVLTHVPWAFMVLQGVLGLAVVLGLGAAAYYMGRDWHWDRERRR